MLPSCVIIEQWQHNDRQISATAMNLTTNKQTRWLFLSLIWYKYHIPPRPRVCMNALCGLTWWRENSLFVRVEVHSSALLTYSSVSFSSTVYLTALLIMSLKSLICVSHQVSIATLIFFFINHEICPSFHIWKLIVVLGPYIRAQLIIYLVSSSSTVFKILYLALFIVHFVLLYFFCFAQRHRN